MNPKITGLSLENSDIVAQASVANDALISAEMEPTVNTKKRAFAGY